MDKLPFVEELEKTTLPAYLQDRKLWISFYPHIDDTTYNNANVAKVFKIFKLFFTKYKDLPKKEQTLNLIYHKNWNNDKIEKLVDYIYATTGKMELRQIEYINDELRTFVKEQKIKNAILMGVDLLNEQRYDEIENELKKAIAWDNQVKLGLRLRDYEERYRDVDNLYEHALQLPWKRLNAVLGGGIFEKTLTVIAAGSSIGKSIALDQTAYHFWDKLKENVVMITLEVSELRKSLRMDSYGTQIPISEIRGKKEEVFKFYQQKNDYGNQLFIKEFPTSSINTNTIEQYLYHLELYAGLHPEKIGAILVDYGDILLPKRKLTGNTYLDQGGAFEDLRGLAQETGTRTISASQLQRSASELAPEELNEDKLADSYKKMFIADNLIGLISRAEDRKAGRMYAKTLKARDGLKDQILSLRIDYSRLTISDFYTNDNEEVEEDVSDD